MLDLVSDLTRKYPGPAVNCTSGSCLAFYEIDLDGFGAVVVLNGKVNSFSFTHATSDISTLYCP